MSRPEPSPRILSTGASATPPFNLLDRRTWLQRSARLAAGLPLTALASRGTPGAEPTDVVWLNDVQSQLNATRVHQVIQPRSIDDIVSGLVQARELGRQVSVAGGRHSMGGQQFGEANLHLDLTGMDQIVSLDRHAGQVTVEAGIMWPALIDGLHSLQEDERQPWTIREKQTGVDDVTLGGSLSSNVHGRGLTAPPIVGDVESFELVDAAGAVWHCDRRQNSELFGLAIGGYGLFGVIGRVTLRLVRRFKVRRRVQVIAVKDLLQAYGRCVAEGCRFGDCQYSVDLSGPADEHPGVFAAYEPVDIDTDIPDSQQALTGEQWARLYRLIRTDKRRAFEEYSDFYRATEGQVYWSDTHQLAGAFTGHRAAVDPSQGTEMITEVYLQHDRLLPFFAKVRDDLARSESDLTYGTIRFIEADQETFLPWAAQKSVCVVCNLHVKRNQQGIAKAKADVRQIIDRVIEFGGRYYLTYHRWATPEQVQAAYPRISEFFQHKRRYDPQDLLQSDWYREYAPAFL